MFTLVATGIQIDIPSSQTRLLKTFFSGSKGLIILRRLIANTKSVYLCLLIIW